MSYYVVRPRKSEPRTPQVVLTDATLAQVQALLPDSKRRQLWAIDLETRGVDPSMPNNYIVGVGMADQDGCFYISLESMDSDAEMYLKAYLADCRLTAFNVMFDGTFLQAWTGRWLQWECCSYGLFKNMTSEGFQGQKWNLETAQREVLGWDVSNKVIFAEQLKAAGLSKGEMWRMDPAVLGTYSAGDADAAWQLAHALRDQCSAEQAAYHEDIFLPMLRLWAEQQLRGMVADQPIFDRYAEELDATIAGVIPSFLRHPDVAPHVAKYNALAEATWRDSEPKKAVTKDGTPTVLWQRWHTGRDKYLAENGFNPNSKAQLVWLFYESMGLPVIKSTPTGRRPAVDRNVLPALGEPGRILASYNKLTKRRGYLVRLRERSAGTGIIHPQFNSVGTVTTRPGGSSGLNMLQMPKVPEFLYGLRARDGHKLIQADAEAIEPVILAQFSRDRALLQIYGPQAKPNQDIYLFIAARIPALGKEIVKYYDPDAPTPEGLAAAKKHCDRDRSVAKTVHLASVYGAFPPKIHETLAMGGIHISLAEVEQIHRDYWRLFAGVKRWQEQLRRLWKRTGGWIPSLLGRPLPVAEKLLKDIVNRHTQTSGHEFLQSWVINTDRLRRERGVEMYPWLVDYYDEQIWEAPADQAAAAAKCVDDALVITNTILQMAIPIKGPSMIADNLAEVKVKGYQKWLAERMAAEGAA